MNKLNVQSRAAARQNLLGHYSLVILAVFLSGLIIIILNIPFTTMTRQGISFGVMSRTATGICGSVIVALLAVTLFCGMFYIHLQIARGRESSVREILYPFKNRPDRYLGMGALLIILSAACELPGIICLTLAMNSFTDTDSFELTGLTAAGIIVLAAGTAVLIVILLSWSMTAFILLDDQDIRVIGAVKKSRRMMRGRKLRLFLMFVSFIWWLLLCILSLGLGLLWIVPYLLQSLTCFYLEAAQ